MYLNLEGRRVTASDIARACAVEVHLHGTKIHPNATVVPAHTNLKPDAIAIPDLGFVVIPDDEIPPGVLKLISNGVVVGTLVNCQIEQDGEDDLDPPAA